MDLLKKLIQDRNFLIANYQYFTNFKMLKFLGTT